MQQITVAFVDSLQFLCGDFPAYAPGYCRHELAATHVDVAGEFCNLSPSGLPREHNLPNHYVRIDGINQGSILIEDECFHSFGSGTISKLPQNSVAFPVCSARLQLPACYPESDSQLQEAKQTSQAWTFRNLLHHCAIRFWSLLPEQGFLPGTKGCQQAIAYQQHRADIDESLFYQHSLLIHFRFASRRLNGVLTLFLTEAPCHTRDQGT